MNEHVEQNDADEELQKLLSARQPVEHGPDFWGNISRGLNGSGTQTTSSRGAPRLEWVAALLVVVVAGGGLFAVGQIANTGEITSPNQGSQVPVQTTVVEVTQAPPIAESTTAGEPNEPTEDLEGVTFEAPTVEISGFDPGSVLSASTNSTRIGLEFPTRFVPVVQNETSSPGELILAFERTAGQDREYLEVQVSTEVSLEAAVQSVSQQPIVARRLTVPVAEIDFGENPPETNTIRITDDVFQAVAVTLVNSANEEKVTYVWVAHPEHVIQIEVQHSIDSEIAYADLLSEMLFLGGVG